MAGLGKQTRGSGLAKVQRQKFKDGSYPLMDEVSEPKMERMPYYEDENYEPKMERMPYACMDESKDGASH